eukprot:2737161-Pyramimonas_sp.AAC.2
MANIVNDPQVLLPQPEGAMTEGTKLLVQRGESYSSVVQPGALCLRLLLSPLLDLAMAMPLLQYGAMHRKIVAAVALAMAAPLLSWQCRCCCHGNVA